MTENENKKSEDMVEQVALAIDGVLGLLDIDPEERPECLLDCIGYDTLRDAIAQAAIAAMEDIKFVAAPPGDERGDHS